MRFVPIKSVEQRALAMLLKTRDLLVRQRNQLVNGASIYGYALAKSD